MTKDHDFKRLVRQRARASGETYMQARTALTNKPRRRRLVLIAHGHVNIRGGALAGEGNGDDLAAAGVDISRSRPPAEVSITDDEIYVDIDHHATVDLAGEFDLVVEAEGHVNAIGISGTIDVVTTDGHVSVEGDLHDVRAETADGRITVSGVHGPCAATTGDGHVEIRGSVTDIDVQTGDGHVSVATVEGGSIRTGDGHVDVYIGGDGSNVEIYADELGGSGRRRFIGGAGRWRATIGVGAASGHAPELVIQADDGRVSVHDRTREA